MAISSRDDYISAVKQRVIWTKTASITAVGAKQSQTMHLAGNPGGGTLAGSNATVGVLQTQGVAGGGYPLLKTFGGGAKAYLTRVEAWAPVAMNLNIYDVLLKMGTFAYNANVSSLTSVDISSRVPEGTDFRGLELWIEAVTAFTGIPVVTITYLDQDGNAGTTGATTIDSALIIGRMFQMPLASGDNGVKTITGITCGTASGGTFNVLIMRPLFKCRIPAANSQVGPFDLTQTGMPEVWQNSCLCALPEPDSTATSLPSVVLEIANK